MNLQTPIQFQYVNKTSIMKGVGKKNHSNSVPYVIFYAKKNTQNALTKYHKNIFLSKLSISEHSGLNDSLKC